MGERTTFNFRVDKDFKNKFCEMAKANGTTATDLITQWMQDYIEGQPCTDSANTESESNANTANTEREGDSKKQDDQKRLNRVVMALEHRVRELESKSAGKDDSQIQELTSRLEELELEVRGNFADKGLKDNIRQIDQWLDRHDKRFDVLSRNLEGLSCAINVGGGGDYGSCESPLNHETVGNRPQSSRYTNLRQNEPYSYQNKALDSKDSYSVREVANEIGKSPRTVRDHLSKLSIGEVYQGQWRLVERKPNYKLVRID